MRARRLSPGCIRFRPYEAPMAEELHSEEVVLLPPSGIKAGNWR